ncbi:MAG: ATP-binding protein [Desulfuromonadales bacterium]|jgi:two-component system, OmpR family, phosphate regulon sensor histidine kinase PhoR
MAKTAPTTRQRLHRRTLRRTVGLYVVVAVLWVFLSDLLLERAIRDPHLLSRLQTLKGAAFILVTAVLLFLYLRQCLKTLQEHEEQRATEQKAAAQDLRDRFRELSTLFDAMNAIIYVADLNSHELLYVNRQTEKQFGADWQGRKCHQYLQHGSDTPCDLCTGPQLAMNGQAGETIVWEYLNPQSRRWYQCFDKAIRWTDGRLVRLEIAFDITERKELETMKDDLLSSVSHEMRTPLTAIAGFAELLLNEPDLKPEHERHVAIIFREAEKLTELINRFLDIRRLKIDRTRNHYELLPVSTLLHKARQRCRSDAKDHTIRIEDSPGATVFGNRRELVQAFYQLLANACRYSPPESDIRVTIREEDAIIISIRDQGPGIPQQELEAIFTPFHRLETGPTRSTGGVGLGLCIVREIVTLHGGRITAESGPGTGCTFRITLPRPESPAGDFGTGMA